MKIFLETICFAIFASFLVAAPTWAATLSVIDGNLAGATGVDVDGTFYDVNFADGTCVELFQGCDETSDFAFQSFEAATGASIALLQQVLVDTAGGNFDSSPDLISGCEDLSFCGIYTPFQRVTGNVDTAFSGNSSFESNDFITTFPFAVSLSDDFSDRNVRVWASWSLSETSTVVPLPPGGLLLLSAALCLFVSRRNPWQKA